MWKQVDWVWYSPPVKSYFVGDYVLDKTRGAWQENCETMVGHIFLANGSFVAFKPVDGKLEISQEFLDNSTEEVREALIRLIQD